MKALVLVTLAAALALGCNDKKAAEKLAADAAEAARLETDAAEADYQASLDAAAAAVLPPADFDGPKA